MKRSAIERKTELKRTDSLKRNAALNRAAAPDGPEKPIKPRKRAPRTRKQQVSEPVEKCCPVCGATFVSPPSEAHRRITCSRKCSAEWRRARSAGTRKGAENPNYKGGRRVDVRDRAGEARWYEGASLSCENPSCDHSTTILNQHHVVYAQAIRREHGDKWDRRNRLTLCVACHTSHHRRGRVLALTVLPASAFEFAADLLGPLAAYEYLRRRYAGEDPRLDALLRFYPTTPQEPPA